MVFSVSTILSYTTANRVVERPEIPDSFRTQFPPAPEKIHPLPYIRPPSTNFRNKLNIFGTRWTRGPYRNERKTNYVENYPRKKREKKTKKYQSPRSKTQKGKKKKKIRFHRHLFDPTASFVTLPPPPSPQLLPIPPPEIQSVFNRINMLLSVLSVRSLGNVYVVYSE